MHLITGRNGTDHITSANKGFENGQLFGKGNYIFQADDNFYARKIDENTIRIGKGQGMIQGRAFENLEEADLAIMNGTVAMNRKDLIVARYERNPNTEIETINLVVITGERSTGTPSAPEYIEGNIFENAETADFPLYEVTLRGVNIDTIKALFTVKTGLVEEMRTDVETAKADVEKLQTDVSSIQSSLTFGGILSRRVVGNKTAITCKAQSGTDIIYEISVTGYKIIGVAGVRLGNSNLHPYRWFCDPNTNTATVTVRNISSSDITVAVNGSFVDSLIMKN